MLGKKELTEIISPLCIVDSRFYLPVKRISIDSRRINRKDMFIALKGKFYDGHNFIPDVYRKGVRVVISQQFPRNDKINLCTFVVDNTYKAASNLASYWKRSKAPYTVAVTGSVGKTTTKEMISYLLSGRFYVCKNYNTENNILGVIKTIFSLDEENMLVLELGTNSVGEISYLTDIVRPDIGVITFIKPVHIEGLNSLSGIFGEKVAILKYRFTKAVLNGDDSFLRRVKRKGTLWFGLKEDNDIYAKPIKKDFIESLYKVNGSYKLRIKQASFFIYNALAAISVGELLGIPLKDSVDILSNFTDYPKMHMEQVSKRGFLFMNDSYNANPFSFKEALFMMRKYKGEKIGVFGDMKELGTTSEFYHRQLAQYILKAGFRYILLKGEDIKFTYDELVSLGSKNVYFFSSHRDIAKFILRYVPQGSLAFIKGSRAMEMERIIEEV